jgi:hypothetical protein
MRFAAPRGNADADFTLPLDLASGRGDVKWWGDEQTASELAPHLTDLAACDSETGAAPGEVLVTAYVGNRGQVRSIGFAGPAEIDPAWADCVVERAAGWTLSDPRGSIAKLSFTYRGG